MIYRDITADDLVLPGTIFDGALLRGWIGPVVFQNGFHGMDGSWIPTWDTVAWEETNVTSRGVAYWSKEPDPWLDFKRTEVQDRMLRVLNERKLVPPRVAAQLDRLAQAAMDKDIDPQIAAAIWWLYAARIGAGLTPVTGVLSCWMRQDPNKQERVRNQILPDYGFAEIWCNEAGWAAGAIPGAVGSETGEAGCVCVDAVALKAGYILLNPDSALLPMPAILPRVVAVLRLKCPSKRRNP